MVKLLLIAAVIAALLIGGVLEVKIHPEELSSVPTRVMGYVTQPQTLAQARTLLTTLKRQGEQLLVRDDSRRLELQLGYVKTDADQLQKLTSAGDDNSAEALAQANLLATSVERVRAKIDSASIQDITAFKEQTRETFAKAEGALKQLQAKREAYAALSEKFGQVTASLEGNLQQLFATTGRGESSPQVAGTKDEKITPSPIPSPLQDIPLDF